MSSDTRFGPHPSLGSHVQENDSPGPTGGLPNNQSLFVRYYKLKSLPLGISRVVSQPNSKDVQGDQNQNYLSFSGWPGSRSQGWGILGRLFRRGDKSNEPGGRESLNEQQVELDVEEGPGFVGQLHVKYFFFSLLV